MLIIVVSGLAGAAVLIGLREAAWQICRRCDAF